MNDVLNDKRVLMGIFREQHRARRWRSGRRGRLKNQFRLVNIFGPNVGVDDTGFRRDGGIGESQIHTATLQAGTNGDAVHHRSGFYLALQNGFELIVDTQFAGAAIVVHVVVAGWPEKIRWRGTAGARGRVITAVGIRDIVVEQRVAATYGGKNAPIGGKIMVEAHAGIEVVEGVRLGPGLIAEHHVGRNVDGNDSATEQLIATDGTLHQVLILKIAL